MEATEDSTTAKPFRFAPPCHRCGRDGASVEVIAPGGLPERWADWPEEDRHRHLQQTDAARWRWLYRGIVGGNGVTADPITEDRAVRLRGMLVPFDLLKVQRRFDDCLGWCFWCQKFYCARCWRGTGGGVLACPRGHAEVMDPYW